MRGALLIIGAALFAACASTPNIDKEAVEDFILAANPEKVESIRTDSYDSFKHLNEWYVVYKARRGSYLLEFARRCFELNTNRITADKRWDENMRAGQDTLRGCRIEEIYAISEEQAEELKSLSDAPGRGNK